MISSRLKKLIIPQLMMHMREEHWKYIEGMFDECYLIHEEGLDLIVLSPTPDAKEIAMQFSIINGAFEGINIWEYVKAVGERI